MPANGPRPPRTCPSSPPPFRTTRASGTAWGTARPNSSAKDPKPPWKRPTAWNRATWSMPAVTVPACRPKPISKANVGVFKVLGRANPDKAERGKLARALYLNGEYGASAKEWDWFMSNDPGAAIADSTAGLAYLRAGPDEQGQAHPGKAPGRPTPGTWACWPPCPNCTARKATASAAWA